MRPRHFPTTSSRVGRKITKKKVQTLLACLISLIMTFFGVVSLMQLPVFHKLTSFTCFSLSLSPKPYITYPSWEWLSRPMFWWWFDLLHNVRHRLRVIPVFRSSLTGQQPSPFFLKTIKTKNIFIFPMWNKERKRGRGRKWCIYDNQSTNKEC